MKVNRYKLFAAFNSTSNSLDKLLELEKKKLLSNPGQIIVEIGPGAGKNLLYYPRESTVIGIEPNEHMHTFFIQEADRLGLKNYKLLTSSAETTSLPDNYCDTVVSTHVLCSVNNAQQVLREIKRILKPEGSLLFIEHVISPTGSIKRIIQKIIKPLWKLAFIGCEPDRDTLNKLEQTGFNTVDYKEIEVNRLSFVSPHIVGRAIK